MAVRARLCRGHTPMHASVGSRGHYNFAMATADATPACKPRISRRLAGVEDRGWFATGLGI
eukprot:scaffold22088_cov114-Isochrysis_galbana.AAC.6